MRILPSLLILALLAACPCVAAAAAPATEDLAPMDEYEPRGPGGFRSGWHQTGPTSAWVVWRTPNRATSRVEYGPTEACEQATPATKPGRVLGLPLFTQFHRLTGLEPGKTCHYRPVSIGTDGSEEKGEVRTFTTPPRDEKAIPVPGDLAGPPYVLDKDGATYVLTRDLTVPLAGFEITAAAVTLDFDGHTLTYNDEPYEGPEAWNERAYQGNDFGVKCSGKGRVTLRGGRIPATGVFLDNGYDKGASRENVELGETGVVGFQSFLTVRAVDGEGRPVAGARVVVTGPDGKAVQQATMAPEGSKDMLIADGDRLTVVRPLERKHRGYVKDVSLESGEAAFVVTCEVVTHDGRKPAGPYTVTATKEGYKAATKTVDVAETDRVELVLEK